jgi:hypothetical protein
MSIRSRSNGWDAVVFAREKGWKPGTVIMSLKSWVTPRVIISIEPWCLRMTEVGGSKPKEGGTVYKSLPKDVVEVVQSKAVEAHDRTPAVHLRGS